MGAAAPAIALAAGWEAAPAFALWAVAGRAGPAVHPAGPGPDPPHAGASRRPRRRPMPPTAWPSPPSPPSPPPGPSLGRRRRHRRPVGLGRPQPGPAPGAGPHPGLDPDGRRPPGGGGHRGRPPPRLVRRHAAAAYDLTTGLPALAFGPLDSCPCSPSERVPGGRPRPQQEIGAHQQPERQAAGLQQREQARRQRARTEQRSTGQVGLGAVHQAAESGHDGRRRGHEARRRGRPRRPLAPRRPDHPAPSSQSSVDHHPGADAGRRQAMSLEVSLMASPQPSVA